MLFHFSPINVFHYLLKRKATQFFTSIAIRSLALGMVLIFEPIYIYSYFGESLPYTMLFFAAMYGIWGMLAVFSGKLMSKIGIKNVILISHFLFLGYYICLFFLERSAILVPLAIILSATGKAFFWPAFHIDFMRFSEMSLQAKEVGKLNIALYSPTIISPFIGGFILKAAGYPGLFTAVLAVLLASSVPLFLSRETHLAYSDSYKKAWKRIFKKDNRKTTLAFISCGFEYSINLYVWPIFMFVLAISYPVMGEITTVSLAIATLFTVYMGRISGPLIKRIRYLNMGAFLTAISWVIKFFAVTPFSVFLAQIIYKICRASVRIPFQAFFYEKSSLKGEQGDEFIIYREIVANVSRFFFFSFLAGVFVIIPQARIAFLVASLFSFGFMLIGVPLKWRKVFKKMRIKKTSR